MKKVIYISALLTLLLVLISCDSLSAPIETGKDESGIDGGIEWMYSVEAYPAYGVERQRQKHYYTYDITSEQIDEYIGALLNAGYTQTEAYGTAQSPDVRYPVGHFPGDEAYYVFTSADGSETIILTYIYQDNGTWISEIDS